MTGAIAWARARSIENEAGCWIWQKALSNNGYPVGGYQGRVTSAYRIVWEAVNGPAPKSHLHHECREPRCVNPAHLRPVTAQENILIGRMDRGKELVCHICRDCRSRQVREFGRRCHPCHVAWLATHRAWTVDTIIEAFQRYAKIYGRPPSATHWNHGMAVRYGRTDLADRFRSGHWPSTGTVQEHFGSWSAGLAAAGFAVLPRGSRAHENPIARIPVDPELARRLRRARRLAEWSQEKLSLALGVHPSTVSHWERGRTGVPTELAEQALALLAEEDEAAA